MGRLVLVWLLGVGTVAAGADGLRPQRYQMTRVEMAVPIRLVLYAPDAATANRAADAAFARIAQLNATLSDYDPESELRQLCRTAGEGKGVPVSDDLWRVLSHAQAFSERSEGAFDVTVGPIVRLWRQARRKKRIPPIERIDSARQLVGYRLLRLDPKHRTAELLRAGMRLDLGGIAKGYAVDEALRVIRKQGISRALVDAGGDIGLGDPPPGKPGWIIGLARVDPNAEPRQYLWLSRVAIATSGDARQFVKIDGRRYSHIVDPRTGQPLRDHGSVTVIAPDCTTADSLASAVSVLGPKAGLKLIEECPGTAAFIQREPKGKLETHESCRWKEFPVAKPQAACSDITDY